MNKMATGGITVIEGEDVVQTILSLQFVYNGSKIYRKHGCFISCVNTLKEIEDIMNSYGMPIERMRDSPSIIMLDAKKLREMSLHAYGIFFSSKTLLNLLNEIYKDIKFTRLAFDKFDLLAEKYNKKDIESLFKFIRKNDINVLLTINSHKNTNLLNMYDNYIIVKQGNLPIILFS